jgi:hypothetical protein
MAYASVYLGICIGTYRYLRRWFSPCGQEDKCPVRAPGYGDAVTVPLTVWDLEQLAAAMPPDLRAFLVKLGPFLQHRVDVGRWPDQLAQLASPADGWLAVDPGADPLSPTTPCRLRLSRGGEATCVTIRELALLGEMVDRELVDAVVGEIERLALGQQAALGVGELQALAAAARAMPESVRRFFQELHTSFQPGKDKLQVAQPLAQQLASLGDLTDGVISLEPRGDPCSPDTRCRLRFPPRPGAGPRAGTREVRVALRDLTRLLKVVDGDAVRNLTRALDDLETAELAEDVRAMPAKIGGFDLLSEKIRSLPAEMRLFLRQLRILHQVFSGVGMRPGAEQLGGLTKGVVSLSPGADPFHFDTRWELNIPQREGVEPATKAFTISPRELSVLAELIEAGRHVVYVSPSFWELARVSEVAHQLPPEVRAFLRDPHAWPEFRSLLTLLSAENPEAAVGSQARFLVRMRRASGDPMAVDPVLSGEVRSLTPTEMKRVQDLFSLPKKNAEGLCAIRLDDGKTVVPLLLAELAVLVPAPRPRPTNADGQANAEADAEGPLQWVELPVKAIKRMQEMLTLTKEGRCQVRLGGARVLTLAIPEAAAVMEMGDARVYQRLYRRMLRLAHVSMIITNCLSQNGSDWRRPGTNEVPYVGRYRQLHFVTAEVLYIIKKKLLFVTKNVTEFQDPTQIEVRDMRDVVDKALQSNAVADLPPDAPTSTRPLTPAIADEAGADGVEGAVPAAPVVDAPVKRTVMGIELIVPEESYQRRLVQALRTYIAVQPQLDPVRNVVERLKRLWLDDRDLLNLNNGVRVRVVLEAAFVPDSHGTVCTLPAELIAKMLEALKVLMQPSRLCPALENQRSLLLAAAQHALVWFPRLRVETFERMVRWFQLEGLLSEEALQHWLNDPEAGSAADASSPEGLRSQTRPAVERLVQRSRAPPSDEERFALLDRLFRFEAYTLAVPPAARRGLAAIEAWLSDLNLDNDPLRPAKLAEAIGPHLRSETARRAVLADKQLFLYGLMHFALVRHGAAMGVEGMVAAVRWLYQEGLLAVADLRRWCDTPLQQGAATARELQDKTVKPLQQYLTSLGPDGGDPLWARDQVVVLQRFFNTEGRIYAFRAALRRLPPQARTLEAVLELTLMPGLLGVPTEDLLDVVFPALFDLSPGARLSAEAIEVYQKVLSFLVLANASQPALLHTLRHFTQVKRRPQPQPLLCRNWDMRIPNV